ncbi:hypothetical protein [Wolbachia endosymbiont (group A) of Nomada hirtipes]|uniref:hypothetical protein n=1 Tax=Wolbachia endosymbiont (group A) of Nomada hirtipes TaxID=3066208 RepID=UPI0030D36C3E
MKKIRKAIAKKFKNWKTTTSKEIAIQKPKVSSNADSAEAKKPLEITIEQQSTVVKLTTARSEKVLQDTIGNIETPADAYENSNESSLIKHEYLKPCENSNTIEDKDIAVSIENPDNTGICKNSTTNILTEIAAQPTLSTADSTDKANTLSSTEMKPCFYSGSGKEDTVNEKEGPLTQQRQAILAGVVGAILLASGFALYIMKMPVVAVVVGIVRLVCIGFALYNIINPNTKLEKVESVNPTTTDLTFQL